MMDSDEEGVEPKKRLQKAADKGAEGVSRNKAGIPAQKINRLKFNPGSLGFFAIAEVHSTFLIVNFTRNTKGFISLKDQEDLHKHLEVGQFIVAQIAQTGTSQFNVETSGH
jgi:hypothetical protein